jgi:hypothetical protein
MSFIIPSGSYGDHTGALQALVHNTDLVRPFRNQPSAAAETAIAAELEEHLARLAISRPAVPRLDAIQVVRGTARVMTDLWTTVGDTWRNELSGAIEEMHRRYSEKPFSERLQLPIWPIRGVVNIIGPTFVATKATHQACHAVSRTQEEFETCWLAVCFVEKLVDAALLSELFSDVEPNNIFKPLISICAYGFIPIGWSARTFDVYAFANEGLS